jgi:hypothetical protein
VNNEPISLSVALGGLLTTGVALIAIFVPDLSKEAQIAIIAFGNAAILTVSVLWARMRTTPLSAPIIPAGTTVTVQTPNRDPNPTATLDVAPSGEVTATS